MSESVRAADMGVRRLRGFPGVGSFVVGSVEVVQHIGYLVLRQWPWLSRWHLQDPFPRY